MESASANNEASAAIRELTENMELNPQPMAGELNILVERHGIDLPADYLEFISKYDGATGDVGDNHLSIYPIADVLGVAAISEDESGNRFLLIAATGYFRYGKRAGAFYELDLLEDTY